MALRLRSKQFNLKNYSVPYLSLAVSSLAICFLSLALPILTLQVYDRIIPNTHSGTLPVLVLMVGVAITLETLMRMANTYLLAWKASAFEHRLSCQAAEHILNSDLSQINSYGVGQNLQRLASIQKLKNFHNGLSITVYVELLFILVYLAIIYMIAGLLVFIPISLLGFFLIMSMRYGRSLKDSLELREELDNKRYDFLIENLEGIQTIKSFALENKVQRLYEDLLEGSSNSNYGVIESSGRIFSAATYFSNMMMIITVGVGAFLVVNQHLTIGALIASVLLSGRIMQPVQKALNLWARYQDYLLARDSVDSIFASEIQWPAVKDVEMVHEGNLALSNMTFAWPGQQTPLFKDLSWDVNRGSFISLTGDHGAGKTQLFELISGIYRPQAGEIIVDGVNIANVPPQQLIRHVGYVPTKPRLFRGTIRDNMTRFGLIQEREIMEVADLLHINRDVSKLPQGFDTFIQGNATDTIPPGLRQRIAMTRILGVKPRLILIDDIDYSLDQESYDTIYELLGRIKGKATIIVVSEDRNILRLIDQQYRLTQSSLTPIAADNKPILKGALRRVSS